MPTQKQKFALFQRLQNLGFTYEEAAQLRRIEMTLHRWAEEECNGTIQRSEDEDGKPYRYRPNVGPMSFDPYPIADRYAGALRRLKGIVEARNLRATTDNEAGNSVLPYHQTDPRGCALFLITREQLGNKAIDQCYSNGVAVTC